MAPPSRSGLWGAARTMVASAFALVVFSPGRGTRAQNTLATCNSSYAWAENTLQQNPCDVAAFLHRDCYNDPNYALESLNPGSTYMNSLNPQPCMCTGAMYVLYSACGNCQAGNGGFTDWNTWMANCTAPAQGYPETVPSTTQIPAWALIVNATNSTYDPLAAQEAAKNAAAASLSSTSASSTSTSTSSSSTSPSASPSSTSPISSTSTPASSAGSATPTPSPRPPDTTPVGAIAGGVVGGVFALALLASLLFWLRRRRRACAARGDRIYPASSGALDPDVVTPFGWPPAHDAAAGAPAGVQMAQTPDGAPLSGTTAGALGYAPGRSEKRRAAAEAATASIATSSAAPVASSAQTTTSSQTSAPSGAPSTASAAALRGLGATSSGHALGAQRSVPAVPMTPTMSSLGGGVEDDTVPPSYESALVH